MFDLEIMLFNSKILIEKIIFMEIVYSLSSVHRMHSCHICLGLNLSGGIIYLVIQLVCQRCSCIN